MGKRLDNIVCYALGLLTLVVLSPSLVLAGSVNVAPEIDGSTVSAGLGLLTAGVLIVRARRK